MWVFEGYTYPVDGDDVIIPPTWRLVVDE